MEDLFTHSFGEKPLSVKQLSGAGSNRRYFRITKCDGTTVIGVKGENRKENHAFLSLAKQMREKSLNVPQILAVSDDEMTYLQEDLGDVSLYDMIEKARKAGEGCAAFPGSGLTEDVVSLLHRVMSDLPHLQLETAQGYDFCNCVREQEFSSMNIRWDLNYFKYCFLKLTGITFDEMILEEEFTQLETALLASKQTQSALFNAFLYRDFQSRNVMIKDGKPYYIDFQGGCRGPVYYDVASFLWQVRAAYPEELREKLIDTYLESLNSLLSDNTSVFPTTFRENLGYYVFFRLLQVLGAYGFRGLHEKKTMFISPISQALKEALKVSEGLKEFSYIRTLIEQASALPQFQPQPAKGRLTVRITSFSYKKGIPEDYSGNGGGFVFDCRAPHNPGRYPEYKHLTGLDQPVIDFLESEPSMPNFISHVYALVDPAVETYLRREFTSLMVNFGCTGGQHRSVYCAQHLADHLAKKYPEAEIILTHREQNIYKEYKRHDSISM